MSDTLTGIVSFIFIYGAAMLGMIAARALPRHHLDADTRNAVSVAVAVVGTLSALVIGLMISTANSSFTARSNEVTSMSVDLIRMHRLLERYGPDADAAHQLLSNYAAAKMQELFPTEGAPRPSDKATVLMMEKMQDSILALTPADEQHRWLRTQALALSDGLSEARWLLAERAILTTPLPFLILLIFWLALVFASFGLFAPRNAMAIATLCLCSLAVSGGILMILELGSPLSGLVRISSEPMHRALALIMQ
jgi:hypothetical protein